MQLQLTSEQEAIVHHPQGSHARVLAVAGSGKTTTLVHRLKHLMVQEDVSPDKVLVLMFNRLARQQFGQKLAISGLPPHLQPKIYTFHAFAFRFINAMVRSGQIPRYTDLWVGERSELYRIYLGRAIENLERRGLIPPEIVGPADVMRAISLWKGSMIPPERAGYHGSAVIPLVYGEFEKLRMQQKALTFEDFVPTAVRLLLHSEKLRSQWCERMDHIIVDEYQDVNYAQQQLLKLLAGQRADMMVVGDDDQTIYEWRGARPNYIIQAFKDDFPAKEQKDYQLTHSFRFGPVLAQSAYNTVRLNKHRVSKKVIAHNIAREGDIVLYQPAPNGTVDTTKEMVNRILLLVIQENVPPVEIAILCRLYAQLAPIEMECLTRKIPYRVLGQRPFFERQENVTLRHYFDVARVLNQPVSKALVQKVLNIVNKPSRYIPRRMVERALDGGRLYDQTVRDVLQRLIMSSESTLSQKQRYELDLFLELLGRIAERVEEEPNWKAGDALQWLVDALDYMSYFDDYYGPGETSYDRLYSVLSFLNFARFTGLRLTDFLEYLEKLDTTQGKPEAEQLLMTSIHRTKGLEWDYVFLPQVREGFIPCLVHDHDQIYDTAGEVETASLSPVVESERRLFYVAITRARREVHVQAPLPDKEGHMLPSRFIEEIQRDATRDMMSAVQAIAADSAFEEDALLNNLRRHGAFRHITDLIVSHYLPEISDAQLVEHARRLLEEIEPGIFEYGLNYTTPAAPSAKKNGDNATGGPVWEELESQLQTHSKRMSEDKTIGTGGDPGPTAPPLNS
jgi:DNA helicase-2/ATP-dependent DNA helicase PcrA